MNDMDTLRKKAVSFRAAFDLFDQVMSKRALKNKSVFNFNIRKVSERAC